MKAHHASGPPARGPRRSRSRAGWQHKRTRPARTAADARRLQVAGGVGGLGTDVALSNAAMPPPSRSACKCEDVGGGRGWLRRTAPRAQPPQRQGRLILTGRPRSIENHGEQLTALKGQLYRRLQVVVTDQCREQPRNANARIVITRESPTTRSARFTPHDAAINQERDARRGRRERLGDGDREVGQFVGIGQPLKP